MTIYIFVRAHVNVILMKHHLNYRMDLACNIALEATATVALEENGRREIDIKRYAKVEKVRLEN